MKENLNKNKSSNPYFVFDFILLDLYEKYKDWFKSDECKE